ncbi:MAG: N-acetylmuramoyl-L-alanine amidase [Nocardioidaceae bacterium]
MRQWHFPGRARSLGRSAALVLTASAAVLATTAPVQAGTAQARLAAEPATAPSATTPATAQPAASDPVEPTVDDVKVPAATGSESDTTLPGGDPVAAQLPPTTTRDFGMVGITWDADFPSDGVVAQIRTRVDGEWTPWQELDVEDDPGEAGPGVRAGTAPMWVGEADGVAARVSSPSGAKPSGLKVATIDPGANPTVPAGTSVPQPGAVPATPAVFDPTTAGTTVEVGTGGPSYTAAPRIVSRKAWGADPRYTSPCSTPNAAPSMRGVIVHHTAGTNGYTRRQAPSVVRGTYLYHTKSQGWCDIGYNFLVDKYGTIYKGRRGNKNLTIRGAHAGNWDVNAYTTGISMMGNFDKIKPSHPMKDAVVKLIGWKLGTNYLPASGRYGVAGHRLNMISGHRDVAKSGIRPSTSTACPGKYGYRWVRTGLRKRVADYIANYDTPIRRRSARIGERTVGRVHAGERNTRGGSKTVFTRSVGYYKSGYGTSFLAGPILGRYRSLHQERGVLGWVTTNIHESRTVRGLTRAAFQNGRVYARHGKAYAIYGDVYARYRRLGLEDGRLGYPTSSVYGTRYGQKARFLGGNITWSKGTGAVKVTYK